MQGVGFEPTRVSTSDLESDALDHSAILATTNKRWRPGTCTLFRTDHNGESTFGWRGLDGLRRSRNWTRHRRVASTSRWCAVCDTRSVQAKQTTRIQIIVCS